GPGARDFLAEHRVVAVRRVGLIGQEERLHRALAVERRAPAEEEHVPGVAVLDLVEMGAPLVDDDVDLDPEPLELGRDGERDVLVERVAPRGCVERELELRRVLTHLFEEGEGARLVVLVALDGRVVDVRGRHRAAHACRSALAHLLDPRFHSTNLNGPVPIGFSASFAGPSSRSALAGMMRELVSEALSMRFGHGCLVRNRTAKSSTTCTSLTRPQYAAAVK